MRNASCILLFVIQYNSVCTTRRIYTSLALALSLALSLSFSLSLPVCVFLCACASVCVSGSAPVFAQDGQQVNLQAALISVLLSESGKDLTVVVAEGVALLLLASHGPAVTQN